MLAEIALHPHSQLLCFLTESLQYWQPKSVTYWSFQLRLREPFNRIRIPCGLCGGKAGAVRPRCLVPPGRATWSSDWRDAQRVGLRSEAATFLLFASQSSTNLPSTGLCREYVATTRSPSSPLVWSSYLARLDAKSIHIHQLELIFTKFN